MRKFGLLDYDWTGDTEFILSPTAVAGTGSTPLWGRDTTRIAVWLTLVTVFDLITPINVTIRAVVGGAFVPIGAVSQYSPHVVLKLCDIGPILQESLIMVAGGAATAVGCGYWRPTGKG